MIHRQQDREVGEWEERKRLEMGSRKRKREEEYIMTNRYGEVRE
jgi:hypothetical protein